MVDTIELIKELEKTYWFKVESFTELDDDAIVVELMIINPEQEQKDTSPPPTGEKRIRLYRIALDSESNLPEKYISEEFATRCHHECERLGYPVLMTWQGKKNATNPNGWFKAVKVKEHVVFINLAEYGIKDMTRAFALAFNRGHTGAWEYLLANNRWQYDDGEFSYKYFYSGGSSRTWQDLSLRLLQMHTKLGDVTAGLYRENGSVYVPMVMNEQTREGFVLRVPYGDPVAITTKKFPDDNPVILFERAVRMEHVVPDIVYDIIRWKLRSIKGFVIDVEIVSTASDNLSIQKTYRLPIEELTERLSKDDVALLMCQSMDIRKSEEERKSKKISFQDKEKLERFWNEKIFCNPWINSYGDLEFLNGAIFPASWIIRVGTIVDNLE